MSVVVFRLYETYVQMMSFNVICN